MSRSRSPFVLALALGSFLLPAVLSATPDDQRRRENEIETALVARLGEDAKSIRVQFAAGEVTLSGTVRSRVTQELSKEVVLAQAGIERVSNRIEAKNDPTLADGQAQLEGKDAELEIKVKRALVRDVGDALARALEIEAVEGVVSLRGVTPSADSRARALETAAKVPGVVRILDLTR